MTAKGSHDHIIAYNINCGLCYDRDRDQIIYPSGKVCESGNGKSRYRRVSLTYDGRAIGVTKARVLCWLLYGAPPTPQHQADHIDGDPLNDAPANLRWATVSENVRNISPEQTEKRKAWMRDRHAEMKRRYDAHDELVMALRETSAQMDSLRDYVVEGGSIRVLGAGAAVGEADAIYERVRALLGRVAA